MFRVFWVKFGFWMFIEFLFGFWFMEFLLKFWFMLFLLKFGFIEFLLKFWFVAFLFTLIVMFWDLFEFGFLIELFRVVKLEFRGELLLVILEVEVTKFWLFLEVTNPELFGLLFKFLFLTVLLLPNLTFITSAFEFWLLPLAPLIIRLLPPL